MAANPHPMPPRGRIIVDPYEVDARLLELGATRAWLANAALEGDIERRSVPAFGYAGHSEYAAGSRTRSSLCEHGGETDGGWTAGDYLGIQVVFNNVRTIAIHATVGTEGTGRPDGEPHNGSEKGPYSRKASRVSEMVRFGIEGLEDDPVSFFWFLTLRDDDGLWGELYAPILDERGSLFGWVERILLGNLGPGGDPLARVVPPAPQAAPDIDISRKLA